MISHLTLSALAVVAAPSTTPVATPTPAPVATDGTDPRVCRDMPGKRDAFTGQRKKVTMCLSQRDWAARGVDVSAR
jgi:hypothetical protein